MRTSEHIVRDLEILDIQINATLNNGHASRTDSSIAIRGLMNQKEKLKKELHEWNRRASESARDIEVTDPIILDH